MNSDFAKTAAVIVLVVVARLSVDPLALILAWGPAIPLDCTGTIIKRLPSPDGTRVAIIDERTCEGKSPLSTAITAEVQIALATSSGPPAALLGVDTGGNDYERPHAVWSAPDVLRVTVGIGAYLKILTRHAYGARMDLHFDPDDAAARTAILKQKGEDPDPPDDSVHK